MLKDKVALVTGGGRGIGRGIALGLAKAGARIVVNDLGVELDGSKQLQSPGEQTVAEIKAAGGFAVFNPDSVSEFNGAENMVAQAEDSFGRIDILVHAAGILRDRMIFNMTEEDWDAVIAVHLKGAFNLFHAVSKRFRSNKGGRIISMSSDSAYGAGGQPSYAAAKAGILGLTWSTAEALKKYGVTTNAIMPSGATRMIDNSPKGRETFAVTGKWPSELAKGTASDPDNVAPLIVYLASDAAANINGQVFFSQGFTYSRMAQPTIESVVSGQVPWTPEELARVFPETLGLDTRQPFATDMLTFIDRLPKQQWTPTELGKTKWSSTGLEDGK